MSRAETLAERHRQRVRACESQVAQRDLLLRQVGEYEQQISTTEDEISVLDRAVTLIGQFADVREQQVQEKFETIVSNGLRSVFDEDMRLVVQQKQVGKRTDVKFKILSYYDGVAVETDILAARGGGVAAVTGFLLRVVMVLLTDSQRVLFLDETFSQVSNEYMESVSNLLDDLADEYGFQFIIVAHRAPELENVSDTVLKASSTNGTTTYKEVK